MSTTVVELSVERLSGVLLGVLTVERVVARERGDPCSVRVCGGRQVEQQRNGHLQLDRQMPPAERGALESRARERRDWDSHSHCQCVR